jgi:hypothetical protein
MEHFKRVRLKSQNRIGAVNHLTVPDVDTIESTDGDTPRAMLSLIERGYLDHLLPVPRTTSV